MLSATAWMEYAACRDRLELPWTADRRNATRAEVQWMRNICRACPVRIECTRFADEAGVSGGFWAGRLRTPATSGSGRGARAA